MQVIFAQDGRYDAVEIDHEDFAALLAVAQGQASTHAQHSHDRIKAAAWERRYKKAEELRQAARRLDRQPVAA